MKRMGLLLLSLLLLIGCSGNKVPIILDNSSQNSSDLNSITSSPSSLGSENANSSAEPEAPTPSQDEIIEQVRNGTFLVEGVPLRNKDSQPEELENWLGNYSYTEMWGGALPGNFNRGVEHQLTIFKEGDIYYASLSQSGWMSDFLNRAIVLGDRDHIDLYCLYGEEGHMPSLYDPGKLLFSLHWDNQELFTTYYSYTVHRAEESPCIRSFTKDDSPSFYEETTGFINEINYIKQEGKWGHINADGTVVEPEYDDVYWYITDHAMAQDGDNYTILDTHGNQIYKLGACTIFNQGKPINLSSFDFRDLEHADLVLFELDGQYGQLSAFHWVLLLPELESIGEYQGEYAIAKGKNGLYGVINTLGSVVVPLEYDSVEAPEIVMFLQDQD